MDDYVFRNSTETSSLEIHELWLELERSYALRAALMDASSRLDGISQTLIADVVFELQELEFRFSGNPELEPEMVEGAIRVRELNAQLADWLERVKD